jgi:hypothetical protein
MAIWETRGLVWALEGKATASTVNTQENTSSPFLHLERGGVTLDVRYKKKLPLKDAMEHKT